MTGLRGIDLSPYFRALFLVSFRKSGSASKEYDCVADPGPPGVARRDVGLCILWFMNGVSPHKPPCANGNTAIRGIFTMGFPSHWRLASDGSACGRP